ncbi:hypothetical protein BGZ73_004732 [Actinomortierella ambigua]|nr:hypothetical protein BGZ73_004732 [Actinomortierella ambigua]
MSSKESRYIDRALPSKEQPEGVGARVRRSIGGTELRHHDPFLVFDEFHLDKHGGFPDHPNRGFEVVIYILKGAIEHEDFVDHKARIGPGDLQWITAGRGIVHAEMPIQSEAPVHGLRLWVNLPQAQKMCAPQYQVLLDKDIPRVNPVPGVTVKVISGSSNGVESPVYTKTPTMYLDFTMDKHQKAMTEIPGDFQGFIYVLSGDVYVGDNHFKGEAHHTLILSHNGKDVIRFETRDKDAHFVVIAGRPLRDPVVQYGPFVMTSQDEVYAAIEDFQLHMNGFERAAGWISEIVQASEAKK